MWYLLTTTGRAAAGLNGFLFYSQLNMFLGWCTATLNAYYAFKALYSTFVSPKNKGIKTIILLQPIVGTGSKQLSPDEKNHADYVKQVKTREQLEYFSKTFPIPSCTASLDLRNVFDGYSQPVYFDGGHTVDLGNKKIASKIFDQISSFIENDIRRIT